MGAKSVLPVGNRWLVVGGMAISLGLAAFAFARIAAVQQSQPQIVASPATRQASQNVSALGRIEPAGEVLDISGPNGDRIERLLVQQGQNVQVGQTLAYLEGYQERLAERDLAATQLAEAKAKLSSETTLGQAQIREAETRVGMATDPKSAEILAQKATIAQVKAELAAAQRDLQRLQSLLKEGAIAQQNLDNQALVVQSKVEQLNNAQARLAQLLRQRSTDLENAQAQLQSAKANLTRSQAQIQVSSAANSLKLATAKLEQKVVRAPRAGQILKIFAYQGEAIGNNGVLQMGDTRQMYVVAEVYETDIAKVRVGQVATVTSSAFAGTLQGRVEQIGLRIGKNDVLDTDPAANTDVRVVEVKIRLDDSRQVASLTNLQVSVAIQSAGNAPTPAPTTPSNVSPESKS
jgi:HlyD family secretion protein